MDSNMATQLSSSASHQRTTLTRIISQCHPATHLVKLQLKPLDFGNPASFKIFMTPTDRSPLDYQPQPHPRAPSQSATNNINTHDQQNAQTFSESAFYSGSANEPYWENTISDIAADIHDLTQEVEASNQPSLLSNVTSRDWKPWYETKRDERWNTAKTLWSPGSKITSLPSVQHSRGKQIAPSHPSLTTLAREVENSHLSPIGTNPSIPTPPNPDISQPNKSNLSDHPTPASQDSDDTSHWTDIEAEIHHHRHLSNTQAPPPQNERLTRLTQQLSLAIARDRNHQAHNLQVLIDRQAHLDTARREARKEFRRREADRTRALWADITRRDIHGYVSGSAADVAFRYEVAYQTERLMRIIRGEALSVDQEEEWVRESGVEFEYESVEEEEEDWEWEVEEGGEVWVRGPPAYEFPPGYEMLAPGYEEPVTREVVFQNVGDGRAYECITKMLVGRILNRGRL